VHELTSHVTSAVLTTALPPRGEDPERLAEAFEGKVPVTVMRDPEEAFEWLLRRVAGEDAILVAGSLFLIGQIYPLFCRCRQRVDEHATVV
jgi:folylpolyglutamate synthase/dihydropteroate synthase